jgi:hypothetical protein
MTTGESSMDRVPLAWTLVTVKAQWLWVPVCLVYNTISILHLQLGESFCVGCNEALINQLFAVRVLQIFDKWNVQDHISAKGHVRKSVHGLHDGNGGDHARHRRVTTNAWSFRYDLSAAASVTLCTLPPCPCHQLGVPRF